jgi:hypothetical protein
MSNEISWKFVKALRTFIDDEKKECLELSKGPCIFGVGVPQAMGQRGYKKAIELEAIMKSYMEDVENGE